MNHVINVSTNFTHNIPKCQLCIGYALETVMVIMDHAPSKYKAHLCNEIVKIELISVNEQCVRVQAYMSGGPACYFHMKNTPKDGKGDNWYLDVGADVLLRQYMYYCNMRMTEAGIGEV